MARAFLEPTSAAGVGYVPLEATQIGTDLSLTVVPSPISPPLATDTFARADGGLGSNWTSSGLAIASDAVTCTAATPAIGTAVWSGSWPGTADQYSEITVVTPPADAYFTGDWIGVLCRCDPTMQNFYMLIGWYESVDDPNGQWGLRLKLFSSISGFVTDITKNIIYNGGLSPGDPGVTLTDGLQVGDKVRLATAGSDIGIWYNGLRVYHGTDTTVTSGLPGIAAFSTTGTFNDWSAGVASAITPTIVSVTSAPPNNIQNSTGTTPAYAHKILEPTLPSPGVPHNFLHVIPVFVTTAGLNDPSYGDPIETLFGMNAHNTYNLTVCMPVFSNQSWIDNATGLPDHQYESWLVNYWVPYITANFGTGGEKHWVTTFSKGGTMLDVMLRNPTAFDRIALFDWTYDMTSVTQYGSTVGDWGDNSTDANNNFADNYQFTPTFLSTYAAPFSTRTRIWTAGFEAFESGMTAVPAAFTTAGILFENGGLHSRCHRWDSGWLLDALPALAAM